MTILEQPSEFIDNTDSIRFILSAEDITKLKHEIDKLIDKNVMIDSDILQLTKSIYSGETFTQTNMWYSGYTYNTIQNLLNRE